MCNTVTISTAVNKKKLSKISRLNSVFLSPFSFVKEQQKYKARNSSIVSQFVKVLIIHFNTSDSMLLMKLYTKDP